MALRPIGGKPLFVNKCINLGYACGMGVYVDHMHVKYII